MTKVISAERERGSSLVADTGNKELPAKLRTICAGEGIKILNDKNSIVVVNKFKENYETCGFTLYDQEKYVLRNLMAGPGINLKIDNNIITFSCKSLSSVGNFNSLLNKDKLIKSIGAGEGINIENYEDHICIHNDIRHMTDGVGECLLQGNILRKISVRNSNVESTSSSLIFTPLIQSYENKNLTSLVSDNKIKNVTCGDGLSITSQKEFVRINLTRDYWDGKGKKGDIGEKGSKGDKGVKGEIGEMGQIGVKGTRGELGHSGPKGEKGSVGPIGPIGPIGPKGCDGPIGKTGGIGNQGFKGDIGPKGERGLVGPRGERGFPGVQGESGIRGEKGAPGEVIYQSYDNIASIVLKTIRSKTLNIFKYGQNIFLENKIRSCGTVGSILNKDHIFKCLLSDDNIEIVEREDSLYFSAEALEKRIRRIEQKIGI